ncbi:MAG: AAA-like domain protein [Methanomassiliicoccales archaeon PtaU1.Bin124]|nr:MAG: AAA-like domain protein [Methanomassiliicoccales archaeon PtaU1.Bin124]
MQTNSDFTTSGSRAENRPLEEEEDPIANEPEMDDAGADDPIEAEPTVHPSEIAAPKERAPATHVVEDAKYGTLEGVGVIFGTVGTAEFNARLIGDIDKMEYVMVKHLHDGWTLGQIIDVQRKTDLTVEKAKRISDGGSVDIDEIVIAKVDVVGYRDDRNLLQVPRSPFKAGDMIFRAKDELIKEVIGLKENTPTGAYLGLLFGHDIRIEVDINSMVQKHVCILAKTGGGKSFLCGDLIEELMKHDVTVMVIDPHGEYGAMRDKGSHPKGAREFHITPRSFDDKILEFATDTTANKNAKPLKFTLANIEARDLLALTQIKNGKTFLTALRRAIDSVKSVKKDYGLKEIIAMLESEEDANNNSLIAELEYLNEVNIFAPQGTKIDELVQKGKMTIINLRGTPPDIAELIVNRIASALFELRKIGKVPPMMLVCEEAHNWCPQQGLSASSKILRTIAAEGRKFGLGLTIISQRAAKIDKNVLSQCNTQMILKVTNPNDLKAITNSLEGIAAGMDEEIQRLPIGVALIVGGNIQNPLFIEVRPRESRHGGESVEIIPTR